MFSRAVADHAAQQRRERKQSKQPYTRPGRPDWELFTAEQWELFDEFDAHWAAMDRKHGRLVPRAMAIMRANRGIW